MGQAHGTQLRLRRCLAAFITAALVLQCSSGPDSAPWCWSHGLTYEHCCLTAGAKCFLDGPFSEEECCADFESNGTTTNRAMVVMIHILRLLRHASDCLMTAAEVDCEWTLLWQLARLNPGSGKHLRRYLEEEWRPAGVGHGRRDEEKALRFSLTLAEVVLRQRTLAWALWFGGADAADHLVLMHSKAARRVRLLMQRRTSGAWLAERERSQRRLAGWVPQLTGAHSVAADSREVHVAMVASAGLPVFAKKSLAGIRSALFFARQHIVHFHLFVDKVGEKAMTEALAHLEPWLRQRGRYTLYGEEVLQSFMGTLRTRLPPSCLGRSSSFGDVGWLRLFVHEVIPKDSGVDLLIFVDAGDYVFLEDPAKILQYRDAFSDTVVAGGPSSWAALPLQLFDLPRMRRSTWSQEVATTTRRMIDEGYDACRLGEGELTYQLSLTSFWHQFDIHWVFEPHEYMIPTMGWKNIWDVEGTEEFAGRSRVWEERVYPGLRDWHGMYVHCPLFTELLMQAAFTTECPPPKPYFAAVEAVAMRAQRYTLDNATVDYVMYQDERCKFLQCNRRVMGVHFMADLKTVPWVWDFLNYWVGERVWFKTEKHYRDRSMPMAADYAA
eukprot:TRINITY_DN48917_c0_g1_i2.p1 TRINITY_DN48917_c0_g1~~TRINITY_DN48917_c0_g1_i2.p1  ORF type:complete len:610 (+),score=121.90 TRINITY_DN48917_c0_g1_i2:190-2019(+)